MRKLRTLVSCGNRLHRARPCRWVPHEKCMFFCWSGNWRWELHSSGRHGIWLAAGRRAYYLDGAPGPCEVSFERPSMKKRVSKAVMGDANHLAPMESNRFTDLLSLVEHCAVRKYDDGDAREPGWFTIKTQGAAWVVQVKDPDSCCSFNAVGETLDKALETAALLLSCDEAPWEPDSWLAAAAARKAKKK